ncbi:MAG: head decoration protein [Candidatus Cloacimonetes bacterium]|nr:head decoration protein [Candidatus Cloacimonadota bacterium]
MAIYTTEKGITHDELLGGPEIPVLLANVTLASTNKVVRGTLLTLDGTTGKAAPTAKGGKATHIAAEDVDATTADAVVTVYQSGRFNREKIIAASGDTVAAHEEELRAFNIYLTALV